MLDFKEMKVKINQQHGSTRYFTKEFYNNYIATYSDSTMWEAVKSSDFYNKNSCGYCIFLEIFQEFCTKKYTIVIYNEYGTQITTKTIKAFNETEATKYKDYFVGKYYLKGSADII